MAYPKPLSEKSLIKKYAEAGLSAEKIDFLHQFFHACANLYGVIPLRHMWMVYQSLGEKTALPKIKRKEMIAFSAIVRREEQPYVVYEIDELYSEEKRADLDREIIVKSVIDRGRSSWGPYYTLVEDQQDKTYYIPEDLLLYAAPSRSKEEEKLLDFLSHLKVTAREYTSRDNEKKKIVHIEHYGKCLGKFSFLNESEEMNVLRLSGQLEGVPRGRAKDLAIFLESVKGTEAEKLVNKFKFACNLGGDDLSYCVRSIVEELSEVGVELSDRQLEELLEMLNDCNNNSRLWCNRGWKPVELVQQYGAPGSISFGPGLQADIKEGLVDLDELAKALEAMGFTVQ